MAAQHGKYDAEGKGENGRRRGGKGNHTERTRRMSWSVIEEIKGT